MNSRNIRSKLYVRHLPTPLPTVITALTSGVATFRFACLPIGWRLQSPGGLFGNVTVENLEEEHSTRNARLMRMMEDMHVVENRGSGINAMLQAMREANLEPPRFDDRRASFRVTFRNYTLMNPDAIAWLNQFAHVQLNDRQRLALVYLRQHESITNGDYRRLNRVDAMVAGQELEVWYRLAWSTTGCKPLDILYIKGFQRAHRAGRL